MNALESRKQLLIAESDLNRAALMADWTSLRNEVHALSHRAATLSSLVTATATLVAGLSSFRGAKRPPAAEKSSWWGSLLNGAGLASSFWSAFRSADR